MSEALGEEAEPSPIPVDQIHVVPAAVEKHVGPVIKARERDPIALAERDPGQAAPRLTVHDRLPLRRAPA